MLRWSHRLHLDGSGFTANNTNTTAKAVLRIDNCLVFLAALGTLHLYGVEQATVYAYLAAIAIILIDLSLVATLLPDLTDGKTGLVYGDVHHAAIATALAAEPGAGHGRGIIPLVQQPGLFDDIIQLQRLLQTYFFT